MILNGTNEVKIRGAKNMTNPKRPKEIKNAYRAVQS